MSILLDRARELLKEFGIDQVILITRKLGKEDPEDDLTTLTTAGKDYPNALGAAQIGKFLKQQVMGWTADREIDLTGADLEMLEAVSGPFYIPSHADVGYPPEELFWYPGDEQVPSGFYCRSSPKAFGIELTNISLTSVLLKRELIHHDDR